MVNEKKSGEKENIPISTKWLTDSVEETEKNLINQVFLIFCPKHNSKGTGFLYKSGHIITNWHVIKDCSPNEIIVISSNDKQIKLSKIITDKDKDLALLTPTEKIEGGFALDNSSEIKPGVKISTWGHPLGYNGPSPLLSVGYISGFKDHKEDTDSPIVKHIVVNGAFNPGNSGGPLLISGTNKIIGVVVSKHAPITPFLCSAIQALANNKSGVVFNCTDGKGNKKSFAESQIVAELLKHFKELTQVMIGEAIDKSELIKFLKENKIT
jgi:hypothetical protein